MIIMQYSTVNITNKILSHFIGTKTEPYSFVLKRYLSLYLSVIKLREIQ